MYPNRVWEPHNTPVCQMQTVHNNEMQQKWWFLGTNFLYKYGFLQQSTKLLLNPQTEMWKTRKKTIKNKILNHLKMREEGELQNTLSISLDKVFKSIIVFYTRYSCKYQRGKVCKINYFAVLH